MSDTMLLILITALSVGVFLLAFWLLRIVPVAVRAIATVKSAMAEMRNPDLDDLAREKAVQKAGIRLVFSSGALILRSVLALAAAMLPVLAADWVSVMPISATLDFMERWDVIVTASVLVILGYIAIVRLWPT